MKITAGMCCDGIGSDLKYIFFLYHLNCACADDGERFWRTLVWFINQSERKWQEDQQSFEIKRTELD